MKINCNIYKCANKANTYLYLKSGVQTQDLPDGLQLLLGGLTQFLNLELDESSNLAQVGAGHVLAALDDHGYFLQLPPGNELPTRTSGEGFLQ
jgi:hypothetical protein